MLASHSHKKLSYLTINKTEEVLHFMHQKDSYKNICQIGTHSLNFLAPQKCDIYVE